MTSLNVERPNPELSSRRQVVLEVIVDDYVRTAEPVASQQIAGRHELKVSPATIRNDMAELEDQGYISRPHASSGGVPSDRGYRFYVDHGMVNTPAPRDLQASAQRALTPEMGDVDAWLHAAAQLLAEYAQNVVIATAPRPFQTRLKQLQLVALSEAQALLVLVLQEARVRQHVVHLPEQARQEDLTALSLRLNGILADKTVAEVRAALEATGEGTLDEAIVGDVARLMDQEEQDTPQHLHTDGLRHLLAQPEFATGPRAREAAEVVEEARPVSAAATGDTPPGSVAVVIGSEHADQRLHPYSVVIARYGVPGQSTGVLCAVGPTRMDYGRTMAGARYLADVLGRLTTSLDAGRA